MKKFEYLHVVVGINADLSISIVGWEPECCVEVLQDLLDDIGYSGWELVGFEGANYIFKRELADN